MDRISDCPACGNVAASTGVRPVTATARVIIALDRIIYRVARRWLFFVYSVFFVHVMSLLLAPAFVAWGHVDLAKPIYTLSSLFCHQRADRSFAVLGEKMACCQRCAAIYGSILLVGLVFALVRGRIRAPRLTDVALLAMPVVVDGGAQLVGLWQSTAATRVLSGAMLGVAICWVMLPYLDTGFHRIRTRLELLFARLVGEGRARPL